MLVVCRLNPQVFANDKVKLYYLYDNCESYIF